MSSKIIQTDMFSQERELEERKEDQEFKKSVLSSIRGLFYRNNELERIVLDMNKKLMKLEEKDYQNV